MKPTIVKLFTLTLPLAAMALAQTPAANSVQAKAAPTTAAASKPTPVIPDKLLTAYLLADNAVKDATIALQQTPQYAELQKAQVAMGPTIQPIKEACGTDFDVALGPDKRPICQPKPAPPVEAKP
jgi:hypothetical protein